MKHHFLVCLSAVLLVATLKAQPRPLARADYGARLEPKGVIQHGAGQDPGAYTRYSKAMPEDRRPSVYMEYLSLKDLRADWAENLQRRLPFDAASFVTLQIGVSMTIDGRPEESYEAHVAAGEFDLQIRHLVNGLAELTLPVYLRIGYEFNGLSWNGYRPEPFKAAFRRIAEALRARPEIPVATVWCAAIDGTRNFEEFYPGDDVVDWYAIDIFSARHFSDPDVGLFAAAAVARSKPLMLGETTPRGEGAQAAQAWDNWFEPFFRWMADTPSLKQFNYINWDWAERGKALNQPGWVSWGDARLETEQAAPVRARYAAALADPAFQHGGTEAQFWRSLGLPIAEMPTPPQGVEHRPELPGGLALSWTALEDASTLARYYIYRDGELVGFSLTPQFVDQGVRAGLSANYRIATMSRGGELSEMSEPIEVRAETIARVADEFDDAGRWRLDTFHADARATLELKDGAARVDVKQISPANWHLQFRRFVPLNSGHRYRVTIRTRADRAVNVPLWLQQDGGANAIYHARTLALGEEWRSFEWELPAAATTRAAIALVLGALPVDTAIWIDSVHCVELAR